MAQQVNVKFVDDLDGSAAAGTVSFALDGRAYEIDLSDDNATKLRDSLALFVAAARTSGGSAATGSRRTPEMTASCARSHLTASKPRRYGHGLARTATRSPIAAASPRQWWPPSKPPTKQATGGGTGACAPAPPHPLSHRPVTRPRVVGQLAWTPLEHYRRRQPCRFVPVRGT